jgi:hypothetical protein
MKLTRKNMLTAYGMNVIFEIQRLNQRKRKEPKNIVAGIYQTARREAGNAFAGVAVSENESSAARILGIGETVSETR